MLGSQTMEIHIEEIARRVIGEELSKRVIPEDNSPWLTAKQLAEYWKLVNDKGEPTTAGILKWAKREFDPLPHAYLGDLIRFHKEEADRWAKEEAERRRLKNTPPSAKIADTLTAAV